jgi:tetratricopeptide (TPR) repeat protein
LSRHAGEDSIRFSAWHTCFAGQLAVLTDPQALRTTVDALAAAASELAALGDRAGEAKAHQVHALALQRLGAIGAAEAALDKALAAARSAGDRRCSNSVLANAPQAALWGPSPVTRASGRCLDVVRVLRITQGAPAVEAVALRCQAVLEALRGRTQAAQRMIASSRTMVEELGITQQVLETDLYIGLIAIIEDDAAAAEPRLRAAYEGFRMHGLAIDAARAAGLLGRALFVLGNAAEAEALSHESEALAGDDLQAAIAWRRVRAETLAARGEHTTAVEVARAAVELAGATDALLLHANARMALAAALRAAGRHDAAASEEARAIELWEAKGATLLVQRARAAKEAETAFDRLMMSGRASLQGGGESARAEPVDARGGVQLQPAPRRVRPNAATANAARLSAILNARDAEGLASVFAEDCQVIDHRFGVTYGREGALRSLHGFMRIAEPQYRYELLATLGDALALCRQSMSASAAAPQITLLDTGAWEVESFALVEVDVGGRRRRTELFAADRLAEAIARLYERHAELIPDACERVQSLANARFVVRFAEGPTVALDPVDPSPLAPNIEVVDHRTVGTWSVRGQEALVQNFRAWRDVADDIAIRPQDILALRAGALLVRWLHAGTDRASGGVYERPFLLLSIVEADGLMTRWEFFEPDDEAEALARFDELAHPSVSPLGKGRIEEQSPPMRFANSATRADDRIAEALAAHDMDRVAAGLAPEYRLIDRRSVVHLDLDRHQHLESMRLFSQLPGQRITRTVLATRGERMALLRTCAELTSDLGGAGEIEMLLVTEANQAGQHVVQVAFDVSALDAAYAELDARYDAGEGAAFARGRAMRELLQSFHARDWDAAAAVLAPGFVLVDHRPLGWGRLDGPTYVESLRALVELAPDARLRCDHEWRCERGALGVFLLSGTREGGRFEESRVVVVEHDRQGRQARQDHYTLDQLDAARARFEELRGSAS